MPSAPCPRYWITVLLAIACVACSNIPEKEIQAARDAIDAARAAEADVYAAEDYRAAENALERSQVAVDAQDYRLALNLALDARERAEEAERLSVDQQALTRREAEHALETVTPMLAQLQTRLEAAADSSLAPALLENARLARAAAAAGVERARAALSEEDYLSARDATRGLVERLRDALRELEQAQTIHRSR